jgi:phospholipid-binding lipoprotein MlaA
MKKMIGTRFKSALIVLTLSGFLGGCATSGNPKDPIEGFNRAMFAFNEGLDTVLISSV